LVVVINELTITAPLSDVSIPAYANGV